MSYSETRADDLHEQIRHWQDLEERATHCPEGLTPLDWQHLKDYRDLYGEYQFRIASQQMLEKEQKQEQK